MALQLKFECVKLEKVQTTSGAVAMATLAPVAGDALNAAALLAGAEGLGYLTLPLKTFGAVGIGEAIIMTLAKVP